MKNSREDRADNQSSACHAGHRRDRRFGRRSRRPAGHRPRPQGRLSGGDVRGRSHCAGQSGRVAGAAATGESVERGARGGPAAIERGWIYCARPDHHLLLKRAYIRVTRGPKENGFRPAIDPMFRSAAEMYGPRVIGVVLSGGLNDGTDGLLRITELGGLAIAQDPQEATIPSMPLSAIQNVEVHSVLRAAEIPAMLQQLVRQHVPDVRAPAGADSHEEAEAGELLHQHEPAGTPSAYTCPECGGALWEAPERGKLLLFRCHIGHGFTAEALLAEQGSKLEGALWGALRALEENAALYRQQAERQNSAGLMSLAEKFEANAIEVEEYASLIRPLLGRNRRLHDALVPSVAPVPMVDEAEEL
ncbi:chemotaxis protein CheB [Nannocystis sp. ncelm1]|uniref:protein-glutamate methylesterase n=1 Tax=Nannocystis radixulma TaxID=2995305 RepID=A0ABT5B2P5_9BACT|nr:chemotaxis protein CheB [Nannocystis radixulma]MDC0668383.1 chemotaxis protein CheB [Nannocystis radixulma]